MSIQQSRRQLLRGAAAIGCFAGPMPGATRTERLRRAVSGYPPREICFFRAQLMTESYRKTEGQPAAVRRAKAFAAVLAGMPLDIGADELIAGLVTAKPRVPYFAHETWNWETYKPGGRQQLSKGQFAEELAIPFEIPADIGNYWKDKPRGGSVGHYVADYGKVLRLGFSGIQEEIARCRRQRGGGAATVFYEAATIACDAAASFGMRYARHARALAAGVASPARRAELEQIAATCERVPNLPARTFREALQSFWFTHVLIHINSPEWSISPGRMDQYLWPHYRDDLAAGRLTRTEAAELLDCLWIKFNELRVHSVDIINYQNVMVGGTDSGGRDASNELSSELLDAAGRIRLAQPSLSMRWHPGTPPALLEKAGRLILSGAGVPALFNDLTIVKSLEFAGVPTRDARDYAIAGCEEPSVPGKMLGATRGSIVQQARCLVEVLAKLANGPEPKEFAEVLAAYRAALKAATLRAMAASHDADRRAAEVTPHPFASLLFDDCLERGLDIAQGGVRYHITSNWETGTITAANSLFAVKRAVFDERFVSFPELMKALRANFEGHEALRAHLLHRVPKFGNDNDEADLFARRIAEFSNEVIEQTGARDARGGRLFTGSGGSSEMIQGRALPATPDGRLRGGSLAQDLGPSPGTDRLGITAMLNSVAKLNWLQQVGGSLTPVKLPYTGTRGRAMLQALAGVVQGFFRKGGMGLHFSVVDAGMLRAAMKDPEKHLDLLVRVGGFSAPFALLSRSVQQDILERTEQGLD